MVADRWLTLHYLMLRYRYITLRRVATITLHYFMLHCLLFSLSDAAMTYNAIVVQTLCKIPSDTQVSPTREKRRACRH